MSREQMVSGAKNLLGMGRDIVSTAAIIWLVITWFTGGLQTGVQSDIRMLQVSKTEEAADIASIRTDVGQIKQWIDIQPRASDWAAIQDHLHALDSREDTVSANLSTMREQQAVTEDRVNRLMNGTQTPVRQPQPR